MTAMKKIASVMIVAALISVGAYAVYHAYSAPVDWDDGAPEMALRMEIEKVDTSQVAVAEGTIDGDMENPIFRDPAVAFTAVDVGVPFVEPGATYRINLYIELVANPQSPLVTHLEGAVSLSGTSGTGFALADNHKSGTDTTITRTKSPFYPGLATTFIFEANANNQYDIDSVIDPAVGTTTNRRNLLGSDIDGTSITVSANVQAIGYPDIWGATQVTLNLKVGIGGNIDVTFTSITATAS